MEASDIIGAVDIVEYISQYCDLEEKGGELWGLSPFKDERTPSFSLNPEKGYWYDFSSGFGGNLVDFVMKMDNVTVGGAINKLKKYANITEEGEGIVTRLEATRVAKKYRNQVKVAPRMTQKVIHPQYMLRYEFRKDKLKSWADEGISWDVLLSRDVRYDAFDNRIVYPIKDYDGNIISVCGRTCDPDYKSKRIRKYTYFQSLGAIDTLYGYSDNKAAILESKEIILFEGAKSCLKALSWGIHNTSALLTSHLSINQMRFLIRLSSFYGVKIVFALDSDVDITKDEYITKLCLYSRVEWVRNIDGLLEEKDSPVDKGVDVWTYLYSNKERMN